MPSVSNAWRRSRYFASVFAPVPQADGLFQVFPISSRQVLGDDVQVARRADHRRRRGMTTKWYTSVAARARRIHASTSGRRSSTSRPARRRAAARRPVDVPLLERLERDDRGPRASAAAARRPLPYVYTALAMPIYEYVCMKCESHFEELVRERRGRRRARTASSAKVQKQFSVFADARRRVDAELRPDGGGRRLLRRLAAAAATSCEPSGRSPRLRVDARRAQDRSLGLHAVRASPRAGRRSSSATATRTPT